MGLDTSIPLQVRAPNLGELADSYMTGRKFREDLINSKFSRGQDTTKMGLAQNADVRAQAQLGLDQAKNTRDQQTHDEEFKDIKEKRANTLRLSMNAILGDEAETMAALPPEKREIYYTNHAIPMLKEHGIDTSDMPEYDDKLIPAWRQLAMTPDERGKLAAVAAKPPKKPNMKYFATPDGQIEFDPETRMSQFVPNPEGTGAAQPVMYSQIIDTDQGKMFSTPGKQSLTPAMAPASAQNPGQQLSQPIKPLESSEREKLTTLGSTKRDAHRFLDTFKDEYGGYKIDAVGNMANAIGKTFGDDTGQSQFWQDYQTFLNIQRNDLFGSALTPGEKVEFQKAIISPAMDPDQIRKNLARQVELVDETAKRKFKSYSADKRYNPQEIGTLLNIGVEREKKPAAAAPPPGGEPVKNWSSDWNKKDSTQAPASKYKEGDKIKGPDGDNLIRKGGKWVEDK